MSDAPDLRIAPGVTIGVYRVEHELGSGAMGAVYAAEEPTIKKRVAIKVMKRLFADDPAMAARFEREARAANDIHHPGIVDVFGFGKLPDGRPYLVMSLLEGKSLRDELARGKIPEDEAWRWTREIAEALGAAHEAGIVHRDLKPDNVFLERIKNRPPRIRILDFGIAKVLENHEEGAPAKLTQTGAPMGTPLYMAPEQWWGQAVDARTDQYALGVMVFEMLAARLPFSARQFMELAQAHTHDKPPTLAEVGVEASPEVEALIARALAKSPDDRYPTMEAFVSAGDAAFANGASVSNSGGAIAHAPTVAASQGANVALLGANAVSGANPPSTRSAAAFLGFHALVVVAGLVGLALVGYAGSARYDLRALFLNSGMPIYPTLAAFSLGLVGVPWLAIRRARSGKPSRAAVWLALAPAFCGATGTYGDWAAVARAIDGASTTARFTIFNEGEYEANTPRFFGLALSSLLALSLAGSIALVARGKAHPASKSARAISIAFVVVLALAGIASAIAFAPSGALVAAVAAVVILLDVAIPGDVGTRDRVDRATLGLLAVVLMSAVALSRVEARACAIWVEPGTRASRLIEIVAAANERFATIGISLLAIASVIGAAAMRLVEASKAGGAKPSRATWAFVALVIGALGADFAMHATFAAKGEASREALAPQFSLFARLDPPSGEGLEGNHTPHEAPALQVAREAVAVNGVGIAPIAAVESGDGVADVRRALNAARASALAKEREVGAPDLALYVDREVRWSTLLPILIAARKEGVRSVEVLLSRGGRFALPQHAPVEAAYVLPADFFALPAELGDDGATFAPEARFGDVAPLLIAARRSGGNAVRIAVK